MKEKRASLEKFQSTLPVRGATLRDGLAQPPIGISIHAPREGSDSKFTQNDRNYFWVNLTFLKKYLQKQNKNDR